jgi:hypothetical protein
MLIEGIKAATVYQGMYRKTDAANFTAPETVASQGSSGAINYLSKITGRY